MRRVMTFFCAQCKAEWGKSGGRKRARVLSSNQLKEIARKASKAAARKRQKKAAK